MRSQHILVARTAFQVIYEVHAFCECMEQKLGERLSAKKVSQLYQEHVSQAPDTEWRTESMIDMSLTIYKRAFVNPKILGCLRWCDNEFGQNGPLNSVNKIHACVTRTKDMKRLEWLFASIVDMVRMRFAEASEMSVRQITGGNANGKGFGDVIIKKMELLEYLVDVWLPSIQFDAKIIAELRKHIMSHESFRANYHNYPEQPCMLAWKRGWPNSAELFLVFIDDFIYGNILDSAVKCGVKNRKTAEEICMYIPVKEHLDDIIKAIASERADPNGKAEKSENNTTVTQQITASISIAGDSMGGTAFADAANCDDEHHPAYWRKRAERVVDANVQLITEPATEAQLEEMIKRSILKDSSGSAGSNYAAALLDVKQMGEPVTAPHSRVMPCKKERIVKLVGAFLRARRGDSANKLMKEGDVVILLDGGKRGNLPKLLSPFREFSGHHRTVMKTVTLVYEEESVKARKERVKGVNAVSQQESMHLVSRTAYDVPEMKRVTYAGTNRGNVMAFLRLPAWESGWLLSFDDKKKLWGKSRVPVGGRTFVDDDDEASGGDHDDLVPEDGQDDNCPPDLLPPCFGPDGSALQLKPKTRSGMNYEPVNFQSLPLEYYKDVLASYFVKDLLDLTAGDGTAAKACLACNIGYVGICCTDFHAESMRGMLVNYVLTLFANQRSFLYNLKYVKNEQQGTKRATGSEGAGEQPEKKQKKDSKPEKGGKKPKVDVKNGGHKKKQEKESSSDSNDGSDESGTST